MISARSVATFIGGTIAVAAMIVGLLLLVSTAGAVLG